MDAADLYPEILRPFDPRNTPRAAPDQDICDPNGYCIYVNEFWWSHINGMIGRLLYRDAWEGNDDEIDRAIGQISKLLNVGVPTMGCGCGGSSLPFPTRIGENGQVQVSYDGGTTWVDAPQYDPRTNVTQLPPVVAGEGEDAKCKAANSGVAFFQEMQHDTYVKRQAAATVAEITEAIIAFLVVVGIIATGGALAVLGGALTAIAASATAADFDGAFTSGVWADLLCAIYCALDGSGNITDAKFTALIGQVKTDHPGIAGDFLSGAIQMLGKGGLINATRLGLNAGLSCDGCGDCLPDCSVSKWQAGQFYLSGVFRTDFTGVEVTRDEFSITVRSQDRGDGNFQFHLANVVDTHGCQIVMLEKISGVSISTHYYTYDGNLPEYTALIGDETGSPIGKCVTGIQFWTGTGEGVFKFTFAACP